MTLADITNSSRLFSAEPRWQLPNLAQNLSGNAVTREQMELGIQFNVSAVEPWALVDIVLAAVYVPCYLSMLIVI